LQTKGLLLVKENIRYWPSYCELLVFSQKNSQKGFKSIIIEIIKLIIASLFSLQMKATVILCVLLLVGVVSGSPAKTNKFQHPKDTAWSRVMMRAYQASDPICCDRPPNLCICCLPLCK